MKDGEDEEMFASFLVLDVGGQNNWSLQQKPMSNS